MAWPEVDAGLSISGVFDLEPIRLGILNDKLRLSAQEAERLSPAHHRAATAGPLVLAYGGAELPELQRQSCDYARALREDGLPAALLNLAGENHFSILEPLSAPDGKLVAALMDLADQGQQSAATAALRHPGAGGNRRSALSRGAEPTLAAQPLQRIAVPASISPGVAGQAILRPKPENIAMKRRSIQSFQRQTIAP